MRWATGTLLPYPWGKDLPPLFYYGGIALRAWRVAKRFVVAVLLLSLFSAYFSVYRTTTLDDLYFEPYVEPEPEPEPTINEDDSEHESLKSLYDKNQDTIGWIKIEGTKTDNVVMLDRENNNYYLNRKFDGRSADSGELYIDGRCRVEPDYLSQNITIYGHHMINGTMFGQIKKYRDISFYREHPTFRFDTLYQNLTWKVLALFIVDLTKESDREFDYRQPEFSSGEEFMALVDEIRRRSVIETPVDVIETDRIVCLSTCTYVSTDARLVVVGRLVREGEDPSVNVELARAK